MKVNVLAAFNYSPHGWDGPVLAGAGEQELPDGVAEAAIRDGLAAPIAPAAKKKGAKD